MFMFNSNFIHEWGRKKVWYGPSCSLKAEIFVINSDIDRGLDLHGKIWNINTLLKFYDTLIFRESNMQDCHYVDEAPQTCVLNAYSLFV